MKTKLPDCPKCGEDELWHWRGGDTFRVSCYLCGWTTGGVVLATGQDMSEEIIKRVEAARDATMPPESHSGT